MMGSYLKKLPLAFSLSNICMFLFYYLNIQQFLLGFSTLTTLIDFNLFIEFNFALLTLLLKITTPFIKYVYCVTISVLCIHILLYRLHFYNNILCASEEKVIVIIMKTFLAGSGMVTDIHSGIILGMTRE